MFELIGDLSVATGKWKRAMGEGLETWPRVKRVDIALGCLEERTDLDVAQNIDEIDRSSRDRCLT